MTNIDRGALEYIVQSLPVKTMIDVGCGTGGMVQVAKDMGLKAVGVDGDPTTHPNILHNFDNGRMEIVPTDLAWSVEFLEHIEEKYLSNVFSVFEKCKYVFCTHNPKPGAWHFNCHPNRYWIDVFSRYGFEYDEYMTEQIKVHSDMKRGFVRNTGTFFVNETMISFEVTGKLLERKVEIDGSIQDVYGLNSFHVQPDKIGIGHKMIEAIEDKAVADGKYCVVSFCYKRVVPFYKKCGWFESGTYGDFTIITSKPVKSIVVHERW